MNIVWQVLAGNLATVALVVSIWMHLSYRFYRLSAHCQKVGLGIALGLSAIVSMLLSVELEPGVYFDLRLAMVETAAVFGGPVSLMITTTMTMAFRVFLGGAGAMPGLTGILAVASVGAAIWFLSGKRPVEKPITILAVAIVAAALSLAVLMLLSPDAFRRAIEEVALPIAALHFIAAATAGFFLAYFRRFTLERDILYAALTQAPDYHYVKDVEHRFVVTNLNVARHNGRERSSQMVGLTDFDLVPKSRAEQLQEAEREVLITGRPLERFEECLNEGGRGSRWYSTSKVPLRNRYGDLIGLSGVTVDITEKKNLEHELQASRNVMARAMAEMSDGLAMFDREGRLLFCNEQYRTLFPRSAYARHEGAHISDIIRAVVRNGERKDLPMDLSEEKIQAAAHTLHTNKDEVIPLSDGRWLSLRTRVADDGTVLAVVSDVTATKESELSLLQLANRMKDLAQTDSLTGLANRRSFDEKLVEGVARASQTGSSLSLLLIDVDRFKLFNDTYGHLAGDECLKRVAGCIGAAAKCAVDLAARFGGEEFAILLPDTRAETAVAVADRLRECVRDLEILHEGSEFGLITVSIGVAVLTATSEIAAPSDLIAHADAALYQSKNAGRDRTGLVHLGNERLAKVAINST